MSFQIHALSPSLFRDYFDYDDARLAAHGARIEVVTQNPGTPCRVTLEDAQIGETVLLVNYEHQPGNTPFRASHAIFVRQCARAATLAPGEVPLVLTSRMVSVRGFDCADFMQSADIVAGAELAATLNAMFADKTISYIHIHYAAPGCFAARVTRA